MLPYAVVYELSANQDLFLKHKSRTTIGSSRYSTASMSRGTVGKVRVGLCTLEGTVRDGVLRGICYGRMVRFGRKKKKKKQRMWATYRPTSPTLPSSGLSFSFDSRCSGSMRHGIESKRRPIHSIWVCIGLVLHNAVDDHGFTDVTRFLP